MRTDQQIYDVINHTLETYESKNSDPYIDNAREAQVAYASAIVEVLLDIRSLLVDIKNAQDKQR